MNVNIKCVYNSPFSMVLNQIDLFIYVLKGMKPELKPAMGD